MATIPDLTKLGDPVRNPRVPRVPVPTDPAPEETRPTEAAEPPPAAPLPPTTGPTPLQLDEYRRLAVEAMVREMEALRLYEPLPLQQDFHKCMARARLLRGSNRSGKTLSAAVELARAVLARDPARRYPGTDGRAYIVGRDEKHLGEVIYRKLFRPGAFKIIRDALTQKWRAYRPWSKEDKARVKEAKPAPPLIPNRYIKSWTWKSKGDNVPAKVVLTTGWEIDFFSSLGKPPRGSDLDLVWLDEEIVEGEWYPEMSARLLDRGGRMIWGATPQTGTDRLFELHQRCEQEWEEWERQKFHPDLEPQHREFLILLADNPHIDDQQKRELESDLSEGEAAIRIRGEFAIEASKVFPEFSPRAHSVEYFDIPDHWTRFAVVDPGRQVCAVLFGAIPGEDDVFPFGVEDSGEPLVQRVGLDHYVFLYDELYITNCDAPTFGEMMARKCQQQDFEAFICDHHGAKLTDIGGGKSVEQQYSDELRKRNVSSHLTGNQFIWGCDDPRARVEAVRTWLKIRKCGWPTMICVALKDKLPNLKYEIERYRYKRSQNLVTDSPEDRGRVHLMACLGYLAAYDPKFVPPRRQKTRISTMYAAFLAKQAKKTNRDGRTLGNFGPPGQS